MHSEATPGLRRDARRVGGGIQAGDSALYSHRDPLVFVTERILVALLGRVDQWSFAVRLWNGTHIGPRRVHQAPQFTLVLEHPWSLRAMLQPPSELALGEAFINGVYSVEGDLAAATALAGSIEARLFGIRAVLGLTRLLSGLPKRQDQKPRARAGHRALRLKHGKVRDRGAVRSHYDVGNEFYALWLDPRMVYSCAYFPTPYASLAEAQAAKLDLICRKLRLKAGERLLDIGCGWGGLIIHAVENYGVEAVGITLSEEQARLASERIARASLADRCRVSAVDYRDLTSDVPFDKIVSVGMIEHVGRSRLQAYFRKVFEILSPGGLFLNHGIVEAEQYQSGGLTDRVRRRLWRKGELIDRYVFPDGELVPAGTMLTAAESAGFEIRDGEALREHYADTLQFWIRNLRGSWDKAVGLVGEEVARTWWLYMAASSHGFTSGRLNVLQLLLGKRRLDGSVDVPRTRDDIYRVKLGVS